MKIRCPLKPTEDCCCTASIANDGMCICPRLDNDRDIRRNDAPVLMIETEALA